MARLQVLHLPANPDSDDCPFALVLDEWTGTPPATAQPALEAGARALGARGVLVFEQRVDVE